MSAWMMTPEHKVVQTISLTPEISNLLETSELFLSEGILSHTHDDLYTICYLKDMRQQPVNPSAKWIAKLMKVDAKGPFYIFRKTFDETQETYVNAKMNMTIKDFLTLFTYQWKTYELNKNTL